MQQFKDYTGSVYGGLGHLLYAYSQAKGLAISEKLKLPILTLIYNDRKIPYF